VSDYSQRRTELPSLFTMYQDTSVRGDVPRKQTTSELEVRLAGHGRPAFVIVTVDTRPREVHNTEESIADCLRP
jgi:hypothetical protein